MKTRNPLLGLLTFAFHDSSGGIVRALPLPLLLGIVGQIPGLEVLLTFFPFMAVSAAPYIVLMKSEGTPTWDRYQLAMPIKRNDIASIIYFNVLVASLIGLPLIGITWAVGHVIFGNTLAEVFVGGLPTLAFVYGSQLLATAFLYPIGSSRFGQRNKQSVFLGSIAFGVAAAFGLSTAGNILELSDIALFLVTIGVSGIAFIISLSITRAMFARMDF